MLNGSTPRQAGIENETDFHVPFQNRAENLPAAEPELAQVLLGEMGTHSGGGVGGGRRTALRARCERPPTLTGSAVPASGWGGPGRPD